MHQYQLLPFSVLQFHYFLLSVSLFSVSLFSVFAVSLLSVICFAVSLRGGRIARGSMHQYPCCHFLFYSFGIFCYLFAVSLFSVSLFSFICFLFHCTRGRRIARGSIRASISMLQLRRRLKNLGAILFTTRVHCFCQQFRA